MKLSNAIAIGKEGKWIEVEVRKNPSDRCQWFVMLRDSDHKPFMLADDDDEPIVLSDLDSISKIIQSVGVKEFTVFL